MLTTEKPLLWLRNGPLFGLIGGFVGTVLMDLVMVLTFIAAGRSPDLFFSMVGAKFGSGPALGLLIHNLIGLTAGLGYGLLVMQFGQARARGVKKGLEIGLLAGAVTIFLGCIPMAVWLEEPISDVLAFAALPHLVWGSIVGVVMGYRMSSSVLEVSIATEPGGNRARHSSNRFDQSGIASRRPKLIPSLICLVQQDYIEPDLKSQV